MACSSGSILAAVKFPFRRSSTDESGSVLAERLDLLIQTQRQTNALLERLITLQTGGPADKEAGRPSVAVPASRSARHVPGRRRRRATRQQPKRATKRSPGLHMEIEAVLREAGHPLPANVIAERIRERGRYTPPRSAKPVSGSNVNSRVANATYRSRFVRRGDGLWLATPEGQSEEP